MSRADTWMPLYVADYQADTSRLTLEQHGAYLLLIMDYWRNGPPPNDDAVIARILGVDKRAWMKLRPSIVKFFTVEGDHWRHRRIDAEMSDADERQEKAHARAQKAAEARWAKSGKECSKDASSIPQEQPVQCPPQSQSSPPSGGVSDANASSVGSDKPITTARALWERDEDFLAAWKATTEAMRTRSSRTSAHAAWRQNKATGQAKLAALTAYLASDPDVKRTGGPGFHLWIRDKLPEWLARSAEAGPGVERPIFPDPEIRNAVVSAKGDGPARAYLDPCSWDADRRVIIPRTGVAAKWLRAEVARVIEARHATIGEMTS